MANRTEFKRYLMRMWEEHMVGKAASESVSFVCGIYRPWMRILFEMIEYSDDHDIGPEYCAVLDELCDDINYYQDVALFLLGQPIDLERSRELIYGIS